MSALAVVTMVRNPRIDDLAEWVAFHLVCGASRVVIYDHGRPDGHSTDFERRYRPLQCWRDEGVVDLRTRVSMQACERDGSAEYGRRSTPEVFWVQAMLIDAHLLLRDAFEWIAFLDHDEFLFAPSDEEIPALLASHANADTGVVQVQMRRFGNSGHYWRPPGLVLENYTWRERDFALDAVQESRRRVSLEVHANWTKSVVRPERVVRPDFGNHSWLTASGYARQSVATDILQLNHYFTRSAEDWIDTSMLGSATGHPAHRNWGSFDALAMNAHCTAPLIDTSILVEDRRIQSRVRAVREELARVGIAIAPPTQAPNQES